MTRLEEIGVALLVGGVRAITLKDQRRKLELQRSGAWRDVDRIRGQLLHYIGADLRSRSSTCEATGYSPEGRASCVLDGGHNGAHLSSAGQAWELPPTAP